MEAREEMAAAKMLARLKLMGFTVFAQYDYLKGIEIFKGIFISPPDREAKQSLERIIELLTTRNNLAGGKK